MSDRMTLETASVDRPIPTSRPAALFVSAGVLFALYATLRPYGPEAGVDSVAEFVSVWWLVSHSCAAMGFVVTFAAVLDLARSLSNTAACRAASIATIVTGIGAALVLPYYGAETFALHALGTSAAAKGITGELAEADAIRFGVLASVTFGAGLALLVVAAVFTVVAVRRACGTPVWAVPYLLAWALFPVQYFAPATVRMAYGILVLVSFVALGVAVTRFARCDEFMARPKSVPA